MGLITWENLASVSLDLLVTLDLSYSPPILDGDLEAEGRHTPRRQDLCEELLELPSEGAPRGRSRGRFSGQAAARRVFRAGSRLAQLAQISTEGGGVSLILAVRGAGFLYTHPPPPMSDGRKMSLSFELATRRTSTNRVVAVISRGGLLESRPSGGMNRTRKATTVYDEIVTALASQGKGTAIRQREVEDLLIVKLGATQQTTLSRHQEIMVRLGYMKLARGGTAYSSAEYDLIGPKLREIRLLAKSREIAERGKGGARRLSPRERS